MHTNGVFETRALRAANDVLRRSRADVPQLEHDAGRATFSGQHANTADAMRNLHFTNRYSHYDESSYVVEDVGTSNATEMDRIRAYSEHFAFVTDLPTSDSAIGMWLDERIQSFELRLRPLHRELCCILREILHPETVDMLHAQQLLRLYHVAASSVRGSNKCDMYSGSQQSNCLTNLQHPMLTYENIVFCMYRLGYPYSCIVDEVDTLMNSRGTLLQSVHSDVHSDLVPHVSLSDFADFVACFCQPNSRCLQKLLRNQHSLQNQKPISGENGSKFNFSHDSAIGIQRNCDRALEEWRKLTLQASQLHPDSTLAATLRMQADQKLELYRQLQDNLIQASFQAHAGPIPPTQERVHQNVLCRRTGEPGGAARAYVVINMFDYPDNIPGSDIWYSGGDYSLMRARVHAVRLMRERIAMRLILANERHKQNPAHNLLNLYELVENLSSVGSSYLQPIAEKLLSPLVDVIEDAEISVPQPRVSWMKGLSTYYTYREVRDIILTEFVPDQYVRVDSGMHATCAGTIVTAHVPSDPDAGAPVMYVVATDTVGEIQVPGTALRPIARPANDNYEGTSVHKNILGINSITSDANAPGSAVRNYGASFSNIIQADSANHSEKDALISSAPSSVPDTSNIQLASGSQSNISHSDVPMASNICLSTTTTSVQMTVRENTLPSQSRITNGTAPLQRGDYVQAIIDSTGQRIKGTVQVVSAHDNHHEVDIYSTDHTWFRDIPAANCIRMDTTFQDTGSRKIEEIPKTTQPLKLSNCVVHTPMVQQAEHAVGNSDVRPNSTSITPSTENNPSLYSIGDRVEALFRGKGKRYYVGTVKSVKRDIDGSWSYAIDYDDGDKENNAKESYMRAVKISDVNDVKPSSTSITPENKNNPSLYSIGDRVEALFRGKGKRYYVGTVKSVKRDIDGSWSYAIDYDDGDKENNAKEIYMRAKPFLASTEQNQQLFQMRQRIEARVKDHEKFRSGVIKAVSRDQYKYVYSVDFDDGSSATVVDEGNIRIPADPCFSGMTSVLPDDSYSASFESFN